jgi:hypothetical protein
MYIQNSATPACKIWWQSIIAANAKCHQLGPSEQNSPCHGLTTSAYIVLHFSWCQITPIMPGLKYLAHSTAILGLPVAFTVVLHHCMNATFNLLLPTWLLLSLSVLPILYSCLYHLQWYICMMSGCCYGHMPCVKGSGVMVQESRCTVMSHTTWLYKYQVWVFQQRGWESWSQSQRMELQSTRVKVKTWWEGCWSQENFGCNLRGLCPFTF